MRAALVAIAIVLAGCATGPDSRDAATQALEAKDYARAEPLLQQVLKEGRETGVAWNNLGVVYLRTNRMPQAQGALSMGARYGNRAAQQNLVSSGWPVPAADLADQSSDANAAAALLYFTGAVVEGRYQGRADAARNTPSQVLCRSDSVGTSVTTSCAQR